MKANELMIGDWVCDTILKGYTKVELLSMSGIRGDFHESVYNENTFEPIPLTAEILEKNGYKYERSNYALRCDKVSICIYLADEKLSINSYGAVLDIHCCYVHELQHALKVCGIEKEIIL